MNETKCTEKVHQMHFRSHTLLTPLVKNLSVFTVNLEDPGSLVKHISVNVKQAF